MENNSIIESGGFYFIHNFDSGNLGHVERVATEHIVPSLNLKTNVTEIPDYEFNLWTRPDCAGTEFENGNRTWFYFGIQAHEPGALVRLNLINLNKQGKMYNQGMAPVTRTLPGRPQWERIRDRPIHSTDDNTFCLTFKYRTSDNIKATTFFAFTYPFSFAELQISLNSIDMRMLPHITPQSLDDIYYYRECLIYSLEGRRVDLLTISSHHGITKEREEKLKNLFPEHQDRPFKFQNKKVIFISARVHPGETPSSFVFNGFLNLILNRLDPLAIQLRKLYVFKMIPFLNPDGVARGHYRTDTRGVNLNRVYLNPSLIYHPTVYASRALIRYYHYGCEKEDNFEESKTFISRSIQNMTEPSDLLETKKKKHITTKGDKDKSVKTIMPTKSSTTVRTSTTESIKKNVRPISAEATQLVEQVYEMKLQEEPSQTASTSCDDSRTNVLESSDLLNEDVLRSCLGSSVHLSTSEELNIQGSNPLRPLRDSIKNSISLLMESTSSLTCDSLTNKNDQRQSNMKVGWCKQCRKAMDKLEETMPGYTNMVPGYTATMMEDLTVVDKDTVYFCTNCFKRYYLSEMNEEINVGEPPSTISVAVSAGDSGDVRGEPPSQERVTDSTGDAALPVLPDEKSKPQLTKLKKKPPPPPVVLAKPPPKEPESGLFLYVDLHGHASKKGIFMYGNHFEDLDSSVECMLLPRIMSLNNLHFHFSSCNFTERNMYLKDRRDGMSREGSGRVAVLKATGLVRSYTLECNYNTGRLVNVLPPAVREGPNATTNAIGVPPKYTPHIFEEVGKSLGASILDLTGQHPNSRIPCSEHRNLSALREWLRVHTRIRLTVSRLRPKTLSPSRVVPLFARSKAKVTDERKENTYTSSKVDPERKRSPPVLAPRSGHEMINMNMKFVKKNDPAKLTTRTRYLAENEPKPKTLSAKRRNILAIKKPNATKTPPGAVKTKIRRSADEAEHSRSSLLPAKLSKRSFSRTRGPRIDNSRIKPIPSCSSDDIIGGNWEEVSGGTALGSQSSAHQETLTGKRRSFAHPSPARLKKIRLKTVL